MIKSLLFSVSLLLAVGLAVGAEAATPISDPGELERFVPAPANAKSFDFGVWDATLEQIVFSGGPNLRKRLRAPQQIGTRLVKAHTSPVRLEGNRVMFEKLDDNGVVGLRGYAEDLEATANAVELASFPKDEQLAFWMNLHNALVISELAERYPVRRPERLEAADGTRFHDTERVVIDGVGLSLRDIREGIVYANWRDPLVIYGFFRGDVGSPDVPLDAFEGDTVWAQLERLGGNYANGMRGFDTLYGPARVSEVYFEAAPWMFPDFEADVRSHLRGLLSEELAADMDAETGRLRRVPYERTIADMTGGFGIRYSAGRDIWNGESVPQSNFTNFVREHFEKRQILRRRGMLNGTVTIEDLPSPDPDAPPAPEG